MIENEIDELKKKRDGLLRALEKNRGAKSDAQLEYEAALKELERLNA